MDRRELMDEGSENIGINFRLESDGQSDGQSEFGTKLRVALIQKATFSDTTRESCRYLICQHIIHYVLTGALMWGYANHNP